MASKSKSSNIKLLTPDIIDAGGNLKDPYKGFIAMSKYARWMEDKGRRETWVETVDRYVDYMVKVQEKRGVSVDADLAEDIRHAIRYQHLMPSMRAMMTAGPALDRNHIAAYNCSFVAVDSLRAFDEALIILMHGTGVGFSVESKYVSKLPEVAESFHKTDTVVVVEDSKEGWAKAFKEFLSLSWAGMIPQYDVSKVRPRGARLKTFGGRASGPQPLVDLFEFTGDILKEAAGRKLTPLEAHDIICKVGEIVVVGGVRRSALISLGDLKDTEMAEAKSGAWWVKNPQRALANNSAVYTSKPNMETFFREWKNLYDSKSGERGIVNLDAFHKQAEKWGRRDSKLIAGTNPCFTGDALLMTSTGWTSFKDAYLTEEPQSIMVDGRVSYEPSPDAKENPENWKIDLKVKHAPTVMEASQVFLTQRDADIVKVATTSGLEVRTTPDHLFATKNGMKRADELTDSDKILVTRGSLPTNSLPRLPRIRRDIDAFLMGLIAGDGTISKGKITEKVYVDLWGDDRFLAPQIEEWISDLFEEYRGVHVSGSNRPFSAFDHSEVESANKVRIGSSFLAAYLKSTYGFSKVSKHSVPSEFVANATSTSARYYVAGLAFADGTVNHYSKVGSSSIRIAQSNLQMLQDVQRIALSNGMFSSLYLRKKAGPNMTIKGVTYETQDHYELVFMGAAYEFTKFIGFGPSIKQDRAESVFLKPSQKQAAYTSVSSVSFDGVEDVYCLKEDKRRILSANGLTARRCGEILLRHMGFCNLTEVVAYAEDTPETLREKVRLATILGTWQASLTNFKYLRRKWKDNAEDEALLGVSLTGVYGNSLLSGSEGLDKLAELLDTLREYAVEVNAAEAKRIGISPSAAITCNKPSGTVSQLVGVSSGIHPWHAQRYIRRVRASNSDPLTQLMKDAGVPNEPELNKPQDTTVFEFPLEAPEGAILQEHTTALDHLRLWQVYRNHWTEHNPSATITVEEHEWLEVGAFVYENFDDMAGVSFLPGQGNHTYQQAPFEKVTLEEFTDLKQRSAVVPWSQLPEYEMQDNTTSSQELACVSGVCEVVGLDASPTEAVNVPTIDLNKI